MQGDRELEYNLGMMALAFNPSTWADFFGFENSLVSARTVRTTQKKFEHSLCYMRPCLTLNK